MNAIHPLRGDILSDIQNVPSLRLNCYPAVASAIQEVHSGWNADAKRTRELSIFTQLSTLVDAALSKYLSALVAKGFRRSATPSLRFSHYLRMFGRKHLEDKIITICRLLRQRQGDPMQGPCTLQDLFTEHEISETVPKCVRSEKDQVRFEAIDTLDALRSLMFDIMAIRRRSKSVREIVVKKRSWKRHCSFCGNLTEMEAYQEKNEWFSNSKNVPDHSFPQKRDVLSPSLCHAHRSKREDGHSSSDYRRLLRNRPEMQRELAGLEIATCRAGLENASLEEILIYEYRRCIVDDQNLYLDNESELADAARAIVDNGISDRKKAIIMMLRLRPKLSQAEVGRRLGIPRQAVCNAINSVPVRYRFDPVTVAAKRAVRSS